MSNPDAAQLYTMEGQAVDTMEGQAVAVWCR